MVREALRSAEPAASKPQQRRLRKLVDASAFIDRIVTEDRQAPVKQRHTARRIWQRLRVELPGFTGSERTVHGYVHQQRRQLGLGGHEVFIPQSYDLGVEAQVQRLTYLRYLEALLAAELEERERNTIARRMLSPTNSTQGRLQSHLSFLHNPAGMHADPPGKFSAYYSRVKL